jgi:hypothetical protein
MWPTRPDASVAPADVEQDAEGLRTMHTLGCNMAFLNETNRRTGRTDIHLSPPEPPV